MNIDELREKIKEHKKLISEHAKEALDKTFVDLFSKYPELVAVRWQQYTPVFNDGDPCEFSVDSPDEIIYTKEFSDKVLAEDPSGNVTSVYDAEEDLIETAELDSEQVKSVTFYGRYTGSLNAADKEIDRLFDGDLDDIFAEAYGDGYEITATKEGLIVNEYNDY